jgi:WD40 repeat protein
MPTKEEIQLALEWVTTPGESGFPIPQDNIILTIVDSLQARYDKIDKNDDDSDSEPESPIEDQSLMTFRGHSDDINSLAITPDGTRVVTGSGDHTAKVWDLSSMIADQTPN